MDAAISHKCPSITFSDENASRKSYENFILQSGSFTIEKTLEFKVYHVSCR